MSNGLRYAWLDRNRTIGFDTWEAEIAHMESLGFRLVSPEYKIPHWSETTRAGEPVPKLYVSGRDGPREMTSALDRYAAEIGYPLFYKPSVSEPGKKTHR